MTWQFTLTGLLIGALVGLTGMGGSALPTPILRLGVGLTAFVAWLASGMRGVQSRSDETQRTDDSRAPAHRGDGDGIRGDAAPEARA